MFACWNERIAVPLFSKLVTRCLKLLVINISASLSRKIQNLRDIDKIKIPPEPPGQCSKALQVSTQIQKEKRTISH